MIKSASLRKKERLKKDLLSILNDAKRPLSTSDLASKLNKAWHTIDRACLRLQLENHVDGFKIGNMNLWVVKR